MPLHYTDNQKMILQKPPIMLSRIRNMEFRIVKGEDGLYRTGAIQYLDDQAPRVVDYASNANKDVAFTSWVKMIGEEFYWQEGAKDITP